MDQLRAEVSELTQENGQMRSDLRELTTTLKDFQEIEFRRKEQDKVRSARESAQEDEMQRRM